MGNNGLDDGADEEKLFELKMRFWWSEELDIKWVMMINRKFFRQLICMSAGITRGSKRKAFAAREASRRYRSFIRSV